MEWKTLLSGLLYCLNLRSTEIAIQHKVPLANLGPLQSIDWNGIGWIDLVFTSSDFQNVSADVTVTHPCPAYIRAFIPPMISQVHFAQSAESRKSQDILV